MFHRSTSTEEEKPIKVFTTVDLREFDMRDLYHFDEDTIASMREHTIRIVPEEEVLLHRIVMHHSIARHLRLRGISVGGAPLRGRKAQSGTCEIFYAEVPNWTPQGIVFSPTAPLEIRIRNENERPWLLAGSVVVFRRSRLPGKADGRDHGAEPLALLTENTED